MKNLFIATIVMFFGTSIQIKASNADDKMPRKSNEKSIDEKSRLLGLSVEIDIGRRKKNCEGVGICSIVISLEVTAAGNLPTVNYVTSGNGTLTFNIPVAYIKSTQPAKMQSFTGQSQFVVEEDYTLPNDVSAKLGAKESLTIKAGSYQMSFLNNSYTIIIGDML